MEKRYCLIFFVLLVGFLFIVNVMSFSVCALPANWVELDDFDSYNLGDVNGTNGNFMFNWTIKDDWCIDGDVSDKYLTITDTVGIDAGWLNDTVDVHLGYYLDLYFQIDTYPTIDIAYFSWYNSSGSETVSLKVTVAGSQHKFYYKDYSGSWVNFYSTGITLMERIFYWNYFQDNVIQYRVYSNTYVLLACVNGTGLIAGADYYDKNQFNCSDMYVYCGGHDTVLRIYEYGYVAEDLSEFFENEPHVTGVIFRTNGVLGLKDVEAGSFVEYECELIGDVGCEGYLFMNDGIWPIAYKALSYGDNTFNVYFNPRGNGVHIVRVYDTLIYDDRYNETFYFTVYNGSEAEYLEDLMDYFGDSFIEFMYVNQRCYYGVGIYPEIAYRINNSWSDGSTNYYIYKIMLIGEEVASVYESALYYNDNGNYTWDIFTNQAYMFGVPGSYQIWLYNTTVNGSTIAIDELVYVSSVIDVCTVRDSRYDEQGSSGGAGSQFFVYADLVAGFVVFAVLLCVGAFISSKMKNDKVGGVVTSCFGTCGVVMSVGLNFWDLWAGLLVGLVFIALIVLIIRRL